MESMNSGYPVANLEELYAKPYKKGRTPTVDSTGHEQLYDRLDRQNSIQIKGNEVKDSVNNNNNSSKKTDSVILFPEIEDDNAEVSKMGAIKQSQNEFEYDAESVTSFQRGLSNQSIRSSSSAEINQESEKYQVEVLETKDTNDIIKELSNFGLEKHSDRLITALRNRFELESAFIEVCAKDGIVIVEGDSDAAAGTEHQSIGGLRVKGMRPSCVNYDEYDPDIIGKYSLFTQGSSREKMANDAAELRRRAANMLWAVENMERMIDPNSRVRYVRQEGES